MSRTDGAASIGDASSSPIVGEASAASRLARRRSTMRAIWMAPSNSTIIGPAISSMVNGSWVGVTKAAKTMVRKKIQRRLLAQHLVAQDADEVERDRDQRHLEADPERDQQRQHEADVVLGGEGDDHAVAGQGEQQLQPGGSEM